jgi:hypothetical protein
MTRRARIWMLVVLTVTATAAGTWLATAAQAGIQGSGR